MIPSIFNIKSIFYLKYTFWVRKSWKEDILTKLLEFIGRIRLRISVLRLYDLPVISIIQQIDTDISLKSFFLSFFTPIYEIKIPPIIDLSSQFFRNYLSLEVEVGLKATS